MKLSRREVLAAGGLVGVTGVGLSGCGVVARKARQDEKRREALIAPALIGHEDAQLLSKVGYGPNSRDLMEVQKLGRQAWLEAQLKADQPEEKWMQLQISGLDIHQYGSMEMRDIPEEVVLQQLQTEAILRATYSPNQLQERMVEFWSNHFNVFGRKGLAAFRKPAEERKVIRKYAMGNFKDLLLGSAQSPAMLAYLDNRFNRENAPNENYAREIMELHTLGVHGGYTQRDIQEVARCLTGWTVEVRKGIDRFMRGSANFGQFRFDPTRHDSGAKVVLGHRIAAGGGIKDGLKVMDILANHPSTARFIATKLVRYFVGTEDSILVDAVAQAFLDSKGDVRKTLRPILFADPVMLSTPKFKRPFDYMVSALRATEASTDAGKELVRHLTTMGQPLYQWPMPDGYPDKTEAWSQALLPRWNFALAMGSRRIPGVEIELERLGAQRELAERLLCSVEVPGSILKAIHGHPPARALGLILASPAFQWR